MKYKLNYRATMERALRDIAIIDCAVCAFLALAFSSANEYIETGDCDLNMAFCLTTVVWFILLVTAFVFMRNVMSSSKLKVKSDGHKSEFNWLLWSLFDRKSHLFFTAGVIFVCWLPILICLYPGTCINDTWGELQQFIGFKADTASLYDHHPIFDTLVMGIMIVPLAELTGKWHMVLFLYVLLQAACTSIAFSYTLDYANRKLKIKENVLILMLAFYCVAPFFPASVQTISKDALFSWIFVFFFVYCIEIIRSKGKCLKDHRFICLFVLLVILCCLTKKVGVYVVLLTLITFILFQKEGRRKVAICALCVVVVMGGVMPIVKNTLEVQPGGKQEMLSIPFQMTARYVKNCSEEIPKEEQVVIDKVLDYNDLAEQYDPISADPVKHFSQKGRDEDYTSYLKVWAKQGTRHPEIYFSALSAMLSGWFSFSMYDPLMNMDWHNQLNPTIIPEWVPERNITKTSADNYQHFYFNLYNNPVLRLFLSYGFYASIIPAFAVSTVFRRKERKEKYWIAIIPILLSLVLGCWMSPLSISLEGKRYLYPIIYTTPLMIMWCMYVLQSIKKANRED